jgi:hypothetical protein
MDRDDLFTAIHKGLRHAIFEVDLSAGATDYTDATAVAELQQRWQRLHGALTGHSGHEDEYVFALLSERVPGATDRLAEEHVRIHAEAAQITAQFERIAAESRPDKRRMLGLELYRALQRFTAACLVHFDEEETELLARIWALCDDTEIADTRAAFMATIGPEEMQYGVQHMLEAVDPVEHQLLEARIAEATVAS